MTYQLVIDSYIGSYAYSKQYVRKELSQYAGKHVDVLISSPGGSVDHGLAIMQQFIDHGDVTVYLSGMVASAATIIAMGAKRIVMSKGAAILIHKCSNYIDIWGQYNADQIQQLIEDLQENKSENDKIDAIIASVYASRSKKDLSVINPVLQKGGWLTPREALDLGLVDELSDPFPGESKLDFSDSAIHKMNCFGISTEGFVKDRFDFTDSNSDTTTVNQQSNMDETKFKTVAALLELDTIVPDKDNDVTVTAAQFGKINDRIDQLEKEVSAKAEDISKKDAAIAEKDAEIKKLQDQIRNLQEAPGDETKDIEDGASKEEKFSAHDLFNSVKSAL